MPTPDSRIDVSRRRMACPVPQQKRWAIMYSMHLVLVCLVLVIADCGRKAGEKGLSGNVRQRLELLVKG